MSRYTLSKSGENQNHDLGKNSTSEIGRNPNPEKGKNPNSKMVEITFFGGPTFEKQKLEINSNLKIEKISIPEIGNSSGYETGKNAVFKTATFEILPQRKGSNLGPQAGSTTQIRSRNINHNWVISDQLLHNHPGKNPVSATKSSMEYLGNRVFEQRKNLV